MKEVTGDGKGLRYQVNKKKGVSAAFTHRKWRRAFFSYESLITSVFMNGWRILTDIKEEQINIFLVNVDKHFKGAKRFFLFLYFLDTAVKSVSFVTVSCQHNYFINRTLSKWVNIVKFSLLLLFILLYLKSISLLQDDKIIISNNAIKGLRGQEH